MLTKLITYLYLKYGISFFFIFSLLLYLKPVYSAAVDERWKLPQAISKGVPDGTKCHNNVQVFPTAANKEGKESQRAELQVVVTSLGNGTDGLWNGEAEPG